MSSFCTDILTPKIQSQIVSTEKQPKTLLYKQLLVENGEIDPWFTRIRFSRKALLSLAVAGVHQCVVNRFDIIYDAQSLPPPLS